MTIAPNYGMAEILNTGLRTFSKADEGLVTNLVRIKKINNSSEATKVYIHPLCLTDVKTVNEGKKILNQNEIATLRLIRLNNKNYVILDACESRSSELSQQIESDKSVKYIQKNVYIMYEGAGSEIALTKLSGVNYFSDEQYKLTVTFFKKWYTKAVTTIKAGK